MSGRLNTGMMKHIQRFLPTMESVKERLENEMSEGDIEAMYGLLMD